MASRSKTANSSCTNLKVRVQPRASRTELTGIDEDGVVRIRLKAPPVDGAANTELLRFLGRKVLGIAPSQLSILRGGSSRNKTIAVEGLSAAELKARLVKA